MSRKIKLWAAGATTVVAWIVGSVVIPLYKNETRAFFSSIGGWLKDILGAIIDPVTLFAIGLSVGGAFGFFYLGRRSRRIMAPTTKQESAVDALEELRSLAISDLLNRPVKSEKETGKFIEDHEEWRQKVLKVLEDNFSRATYLRFDRLGVIPAIQFGVSFDAKHNHQLQMLSVRLERIMQITAPFIG